MVGKAEGGPRQGKDHLGETGGRGQPGADVAARGTAIGIAARERSF